MGYDLCRFTKKIDNEFLCPICHDVLENAFESLCEHNFCNACIKTWLKNSNICPLDNVPLNYRDVRPITRALRNLLLKLEIKCDFETEGCQTVIELGHLESHAKLCLYNPDLKVKCDKDCGLEMSKKEYENHSCVGKLIDLVVSLQKRISFLEKLINDSQEKNGWRITNGLYFANDSIIKCKSCCAQIAQHVFPLNGSNYFQVKIIRLGESVDCLWVGMFNSYTLGDENKLNEENSVIDYRSDGIVHLRQENELSADLLGQDWNEGDVIECGIKFANKVVVYFKHNNVLVTEAQVEYSAERFYPSVYIWSNGAKVQPKLYTGAENI